MVSENEIKLVKETIDKLVQYQNSGNALNDVLTFAEACALIGKAPNYFTELVKRGKLVDGEDYRMAGRIGLIKKDVALKYK